MDKQLDDPEPQVLIKNQTIREVTNCAAFFDLLPEDWRESLLPKWGHYRNCTHLYGVYEEGTLLGGGLVFSKPAPDTDEYMDLAEELFEEGYLYIGFLWIAPENRGKGLGTFWLESVKQLYPENPFWLVIEEKELMSFYLTNGFELKQKIHHEDGFSEWIFVENRTRS